MTSQFAIDKSKDEYPTCPAGKYGEDDQATLMRLFLGESRRKDDPEGTQVVSATVKWTFPDDEGVRRPMTRTEQFPFGVMRLVRQLGVDLDSLEKDTEGNPLLQIDEERGDGMYGNILVNGVKADGMPVEIDVTATTRNGRTYNNIKSIWKR